MADQRPAHELRGGDYTADGLPHEPGGEPRRQDAPILRFVHDFVTEGGYDGGTVEMLVNGAWTKVAKSAFTLNRVQRHHTRGDRAELDSINSSAFTGYRHPATSPT